MLDESYSEKQCENEIKKMFNWMKKPKKENEIEYLKKRGHCNNYSSHCCLSCDRCWGGRKSYMSTINERKTNNDR